MLIESGVDLFRLLSFNFTLISHSKVVHDLVLNCTAVSQETVSVAKNRNFLNGTILKCLQQKKSPTLLSLKVFKKESTFYAKFLRKQYLQMIVLSVLQMKVVK